MKTASIIKKLAMLCILTCVTQCVLAQAPGSAVDIKTGELWVKSRVWARGLTLKIHSPVNPTEFEQQYMSNTAYWDEAFQFLSNINVKIMTPGKYVIDGDNVFATITCGPNKLFAVTKWESHRKYVDLQYVIDGKEKMGYAPVTSAHITESYDTLKDAARYNTKGRYYIATPKEFFLFFPEDAHRPNILVKGYDTVKKLVIKIKYKNLHALGKL